MARKPLMSALRRAQEAVKNNPGLSNVQIAEKAGVNEKAVRNVKKSASDYSERGKPTRRWWSMATDRELIVLPKTQTLEAIADELKRPPAYILKRAARLGASIKRKAKAK